MGDFLLFTEGEKEYRVKTKVFEEAGKLRPLLNPAGWEIYRLLSEKPHYPAEIAKRLSMHEQNVYYYIKQLRDRGLIELKGTEEKQGTLAKYFSAAFSSFSVVPDRKRLADSAEFSLEGAGRKIGADLEEFFTPFIHNGVLDAKIVVGSPDPHGKMKARAKDGHLAVELSAFLGSMCRELKFPLIFLDTMVKGLEEENSNFIIIGGILTNKLAEEINKKCKGRFRPSGGHWTINSLVSGKEYIEDSMGVIEKIPHPFFPKKSILLVAGKRSSGTKAAILALVKHSRESVKPNSFDRKSAMRVVEGLDLDGDGLVDAVEFRE